jgi:hypothetical protein
MTLSPPAKSKVDGLRTKLSAYLTDLYSFAQEKGYVGSIPSPNPSNMCDLYRYIKDILSWIKSDYNQKLA